MIALLHAMEAANCRTLVFSSSATVYGDPASVPITEDFARSHTNPYGHGKLVCEDMLAALGASNKAWRFGVLRYFNPVGAHPSGLIGKDLAAGHVAALQALLQGGAGGGSFTVNLGTGKGYSVLDVVRAFEQASGKKVPYRFAPRRAGDVAQCYADASLAQRLLGWRATQTLPDMCRDAWRWQSRIHGSPQE